MDRPSRGRGGGFRARGGAGRGGRGGRSGATTAGDKKHHANSNSNSKGKGSSAAHQQRGGGGEPAKAKPTPAPAEKYVVIISNVENDFAKVHHDRLPAFLCLDANREGRGSLSKGIKAADDEASRHCYYDLACRSETRSAELSIYGAADADVGSVFASRSTTSAAPSTRGAGSDAAEAEATDPTGTLDVAEHLVAGHKGPGEGRPAFASIEDMAALLSAKPYFTHRVGFHVNIPGKNAGEVLEVSDGCQRRIASRQSHLKQRQKRKSGDAVAAGEGVGGSCGDRGAAKRAREDGNDNDEAEAKARARKEVDVSSDHDEDADHSEEDDVEGSDGPAEHEVDGMAMEALKQFPYRQKDMVTAVAAVSAGQWTAREVRHHLKDLPGFLSCWKLYAKHFRVVFQDAESLFKAKQLLDQFHLDDNVRVSLTLSDALARLNADYIAKEEAMGDFAADL